jgi:predicted RNA-binding protein with PUA domain
MKVGAKRRRTKEQIREQEAQEAAEKEETARKLEELDEMQRRQAAMETELQSNRAVANILTQMIASGAAVQDEGGSVFVKGVNPEFDQVREARQKQEEHRRKTMPPSFEAANAAAQQEPRDAEEFSSQESLE